MIMMRKGQTALEYLMTYGWAILIVIVVVAALYSLGLTKPCRWVGTQITGFGEVAVSGIKFTPDNLYISIQRQKPEDITITGVSFASAANGNGVNTTSITLTSGASPTAFIVPQAPGGKGGSVGDCYAIDVTINYTDMTTNVQHQSLGRITGMIESE